MRSFVILCAGYWMSSAFLIFPMTVRRNEIFPPSATVIPNLSLGLSLSSPYLAPDQLDSVMRRMLTSRISRRVLAEHHIALTEIFMGQREKQAAGEPHVGIIFTGLKVKKNIERCVELLRQRPTWVEDFRGKEFHVQPWPEVVVDGQLDTHFPYIKEHVE